MYSVWTKHIRDEENKEDFLKKLYSSRTVLDRLKALLEEDERDVFLSEIGVADYQKASWPYLQAHKNGYRAALNTIKNLIDLDQQNKGNK